MIRKLLNGWEAYEIWICPRCLPRIRQPGSADFALSLLHERAAALTEARELELAAWRVYVPAFLEEMRASYRRHRVAWERLLARDRVVLACACKAPERCHRTILATAILPKLGAVYAGERASRRDGVHLELVEVAT